MTDYFALLNEPRRPWLEPDKFKQKFLALSAEVHPDRTHNASPAEKDAAQQRYTELNAAYRCLGDPKERLRHLLKLELGANPKDVERIPQALMNLFLEVSQLCRQADALLGERAAVTSPLLKVQLFERGQEWTDKLMALQKDLNARRETLMSELQAIDAAWDSNIESGSPNRDLFLQRLEELYRLFSYFARWNAQIQERIIQLSF